MRGGLGCWSGDVGKLVMVFAMGKECVSDGSRKCHWRIGRRDGKEVWPGMQPCRRADASCRRRTIGFAQADSFLFSSFVLTGVDETKATANGISGGVERVATYTKRRVE